MKAPRLLTAKNALPTARRFFAEEGYTGPVELAEGDGWIEVFVDESASDKAIEVSGGRLAEIKNIGVALRITRRMSGAAPG
ncbi:MAG TPA: hypothetical protein PKA50_16440 [Gemmatimonadales bacterium]|nr:hypothetical protein [Gemmatimonadales bacterium]